MQVTRNTNNTEIELTGSDVAVIFKADGNGGIETDVIFSPEGEKLMPRIAKGAELPDDFSHLPIATFFFELFDRAITTPDLMTRLIKSFERYKRH